MLSLIVLYILLLVDTMSFSIYNNSPYLLGTYLLRNTNDKTIKTKIAYLTVNNNNIKLKTIIQSGVFATKISKTGTVEYRTTFKNFACFVFGIPNYDIIVRFNNVNKYSYSFCGIEFPEIRYKQISNYNIEKRMQVQTKYNTMFVKDDGDNYYLFDLYSNIAMNRLPYAEITVSTLIASEVINNIINYGIKQISESH
jgi:hypothetical protein